MELVNFETIKSHIKVRLVNENTEVNAIKKSAAEYGFPGLILYPIINLGETDEGVALIKINEDIVRDWGVTEDDVFEVGISNINYQITTMRDMLRENMLESGMPEDIIDMMLPEDDPMYVISNRSNYYGAVSVIPATKYLLNRFPDGYIVLPSSVHEVIVIPKGIGDSEYLNEMVKEINANVVGEKDKLSDDIYEFTE